MKLKLLILQEFIPNYRLPIFRNLALQYKLTIGSPNHYKFQGELFKTIQINSFQYKSIHLPAYSLFKYCKQFDVIIIMPDLHFLNFCILPFVLNKKKIISWSIGLRASYKLRYDYLRNKTFLDYILLLVLRNCDANIFYYSMPKLFWGRLLNNEKLFVATNTVDTCQTEHLQKVKISDKKTIIFLGSLIEGKGILDLLKIFRIVIEEEKKFDLNLLIIGDGPLKEKIKKFIIDNQLRSRVFIKGPIFEENRLATYFRKSICMVTPNQAGLSVLMSMGYGVPVVTKFDSITGGERFNIKNENGFLYKNENELKKIIFQTYKTPNLFIRKGEKAKEYYRENTTINHMLKGFNDAISYVTNKN